MSKLDVSTLPPPTEEFMVAMAFYKEVIADYGRHSPAACVALAMAFEHAPQGLLDRIASDARDLGLTPQTMNFGPDGEPVYTVQDLANFYEIDIAAVKADIHHSMNVAPQGSH